MKKLWKWLRSLFDRKPNTIPVPVREFTEEERLNHWIWLHADVRVRD